MGAEESPKVAAAPVRLICRYSNGVVKSFLARGVSRKDELLRVLTSEQFEPGIELTVMAPFLSAAQSCRVMGIQRGHEPGYSLLELRLLGSAPALVQHSPAWMTPSCQLLRSSYLKSSALRATLNPSPRNSGAGWCTLWKPKACSRATS